MQNLSTQNQSIKELLKCFDYIRQYHADMLDSIAIILEIIWLKHQSKSFMESLISKASKRKPIYDEFSSFLQSKLGDKLYIPLNPKSNLLKILKVIIVHNTSHHILEEFLHIITQRRTTHKLFSYSTPLELNELLVGLLDIQDGQSIYNPCYGMGSLFFAIAHHANVFTLYGEELESSLSRIAKIICKILNLNSDSLILNNILTHAHFKNQTFDKIICNPPLNSHIGTQFLKDDERFATYEPLIKTYPELLFLIHSLSYLKGKGAFILRTQALQKSSIEERLREKLCEEGLIESIIELPKNIFPHQNDEFSIMVLSPNNRSILHINANTPFFYHKVGKYNRLINLGRLLEIYHARLITPHSTLTPLDQINLQDLRVQHYIYKPQETLTNTQKLQDLNVNIFRGQRVYGNTKDEKITYFDLGIADFADYGFCEEFSIQRFKGEIAKIEKYTLKPYDIALSIRSTTPKFTILGPEISHYKVIANAGILIIRAPTQHIAIGLYCFLFSHAGLNALNQIYEHKGGNITPQDLQNLPIPIDFCLRSQNTFSQIQSYSSQLREIESKLQNLRK